MIHVITQQDIEQHRPALIAWAEANGLDASRMKQDGITIEQHGDRAVIVYDEYLVDGLGRKVVDLTGPSRYQTVRRSRTLRHALPEGIGRPLCLCTLGKIESDCPDHGHTRS